MFRILSIDGGGIHGVIPAVVLEEIESRAGRPISDLFDLFVGTSTGGILATGLVLPAADGEPRYTASQLVDFYTTRGHEIFPSLRPSWFSSIVSLVSERFSEKPYERILREYLGDARLSETLKPLIMPSYDIKAGSPYFFKTRRAIENPAHRDHALWEAVRATSAAPTYFEPKSLQPDAQGSFSKLLIDGGVFVNNPTMCAYAEALDLEHSPDEIIIASLGTGHSDEELKKPRWRNWGQAYWARPISEVMMDGSADAVHYQLKRVVPDTSPDKRYFRFDTYLPQDIGEFTDASAANLEKLIAVGRQIVTSNSSQIDLLISKL